MKTGFFLLILAFSLSSMADVKRIHSATDSFIKFDDGVVGFLKQNTRHFFHPYHEGREFQVELDSHNEILSLIPTFRTSDHPPFLTETISAENFAPTVISSYKRATRLLETFLNADIENSQCYDRAHVWSYNAEKSSVHLEKAWIFFADHFIEKNHFKWWFHVAPLASVKMQGEVKKRVMDKKFSVYPLQVKIWTDLFIEGKETCRQVESYTDYSEHPGEDDCYLIESTPYYWQPKDLEALAKNKEEKGNWIKWELRHAFQHAYGIVVD